VKASGDFLTSEKLVVWGHSLGTNVATFEGETHSNTLRVDCGPLVYKYKMSSVSMQVQNDFALVS